MDSNSDCINYRDALVELIKFVTNPQPKYEFGMTGKVHELRDLVNMNFNHILILFYNF